MSLTAATRAGGLYFSPRLDSTQEAHNAIDFKHSCYGEPGSGYRVSSRSTPCGPGSLSPFDHSTFFPGRGRPCCAPASLLNERDYESKEAFA